MTTLTQQMKTVVHRSSDLKRLLERVTGQNSGVPLPPALPGWLRVMEKAFGHTVYLIEARSGDAPDCNAEGWLPLAEVSSLLFGKFLVSLPYVNSAGISASHQAAATALIDRAVQLAREEDVRYLELRQETEHFHRQLQQKRTSKTLMRLPLPKTSDELWNQFKSKLRSQIRSGMAHSFDACWGRHELLDDFYGVFSQRMRDLGTPVYGKQLFRSILDQFPKSAEFCCLRQGTTTIAAALLIHDEDSRMTEVPSAASLSSFHPFNANMVMYWRLLERSIERQSLTFDFGRSTVGSGTWRFKKQWGAQQCPSIWQYHVRKGSHEAMRPEQSRFGLATRAWRRLPVPVTRWIGPAIVRGIP